ncbi:MAG: hypothetical protein JKY95_03095 [Planctomycetaceae bacterium]|nr:hypothetical protein [Planctomycetaceae bacterium]
MPGYSLPMAPVIAAGTKSSVSYRWLQIYAIRNIYNATFPYFSGKMPVSMVMGALAGGG